MAVLLYKIYETGYNLCHTQRLKAVNFDNSESSFPQFPYPSLRDAVLKDGKQWLRGKALDDGAEGLWRVHDNLYDFSDFIDYHPGGKDWLLVTKGTDITEAFEAHHISILPEKMLCKFFIRKAEKQRNSPFTFKEDGFYRTLKSHVREELKKAPKNLESKSKRIIELLAICYFVASICVSRANWMPLKLFLYLFTSVLLSWTVIAAHNFLHLKDNWRMYLFDLGCNSFREFRKIHVLSHHLYPNTLWDYEVSHSEPYIQWLPRKSKTFFNRYAAVVYSNILLAFTLHDSVASKLYRFLFYDKKWKIRTTINIPMINLLLMLLFGAPGIFTNIYDWLVIMHIGNWIFSLIGVNAAHHHPSIFHDGDTPQADQDWGLHQLRAVMDRVEFTDSSFLVLTNYGDHALHHLFPTLDHAYLPFLYPITRKICAEFNTELRTTTHVDMVLGQFKQLIKNKPS